MFKTDSLLSQMQFFVTVFFSVCLLILIGFTIQTSIIDFKHLKLRAHHQNLQFMDHFIGEINKQYENIISVLQEKNKFHSIKNIKYLQAKNRRFVNRLNREYLIPSEYKKYKAGKIGVPIDVKALQLDKEIFDDMTRRVTLVLEDGHLPHKIIANHYKNKPILKKIAALNLKVISDPETRGLYLSKADFRKLDLLDGDQDDGFYHPEFTYTYNHSIAKFGVDLATWGVIGTPEELTQNARPFSEKAKKHYSKNASMHWTETALLRSTFKLGEVPHVIMDHVQRIANFDFSSGAQRIANFGSTDMLWEVFPLDFYAPKSDRVALYPSQVICVKLDKIALYKSIIARVITQYKQKYGVVVKFGDGEDAVYSDVRHGHVLQSLSPILWKQHDINLEESEIFIPGKDLPDWLEPIKDLSRLDAQIPKLHNLSHPFLGKQYLSYRFRKVDQSFSVGVYQSELSIMKYFLMRWTAVFLLFLLLIAYFKNVLNKGLSFLNGCVNSCLITSFDRAGSDLDGKIKGGIHEFDQLKTDIRSFQLNSKHKLNLMELQQKVQPILNQDRKTLKFYLNDFFYSCADTSNRFYWSQTMTSNLIHKLTIVPKPEFREFLITHLKSEVLDVWFEFQLNKSERKTIENAFQTIIEKAYFEQKLIEADKLHSDVLLAQKIQKDLFLLGAFQGSFNNRFNFHFSGDTQLNFDLANYVNKVDAEFYYHASILNNGLGVALQTCHIKAYLEGLIDIYESPKVIIEKLNTFIKDEEFADLFISIVLVKVKEDILTVSNAGHGGVYDFKKRKFHTCSVPPIGLIYTCEYSEIEIAVEDCGRYDLYDLQSQLVLTMNPAGFVSEKASMLIQMEFSG